MVTIRISESTSAAEFMYKSNTLLLIPLVPEPLCQSEWSSKLYLYLSASQSASQSVPLLQLISLYLGVGFRLNLTDELDVKINE